MSEPIYLTKDIRRIEEAAKDAPLMQRAGAAAAELAARLCAEAKGGEVLVCQRTMASIDEHATLEPVGPLTLRGFAQLVPAFRVAAMK